MELGGYQIDINELREVVEKDLYTHRIIMRMVKNHIDDILMNEFDIDPNRLREEDPSTYWAIIMELTRSELINVANYLRYKSYKRNKQWPRGG